MVCRKDSLFPGLRVKKEAERLGLDEQVLTGLSWKGQSLHTWSQEKQGLASAPTNPGDGSGCDFLNLLGPNAEYE